jgi:glycosyltransferase involved in cell wall biosynthesis
MNPLVTVFIPVYNGEKYIREALDSILNQTYKNLDVLIVDDGSTDRSVQIIQSYNDPRIRLIQNSQNKGIPYTRNIAIREARGKYLVLMDADDIASPKRIELQVAYLENHLEIDAVGSYYIKFTETSKKKIAPPFISPKDLQMMMIFFDPIANPSSTVRVESIKKYKLSYHPNYFVAQDYDFWARLSKVGKISILPEFLLYYRSGHDNITKKSISTRLEKRKQITRAIHADLLEFYGIFLTEKELDTFNEFFSYYYGSIEQIDLVESIINKLKKWNEIQQIFNQTRFLQILDYCVLVGISNQQLNMKKKIHLFQTLLSNRKLKSLLYILTKHMYYRTKLV